MSKDEENIINIDSFNRFINKVSKANTINKFKDLMIDLNITHDSKIYFKDVREKLNIEHCVLISSNHIALRYLQENGSQSFNKYHKQSQGFSSLLYISLSDEERDKIYNDPNNFLINNYGKRHFGNYPIKPISLDFISTIIDLFPETLNYDKFLTIIVDYYQNKEIPENIRDGFKIIFGEHITSEGLEYIIKADGNKRIYFSKNAIEVIEEKIPEFYSLKRGSYSSYILGSPYTLGMIDKLFNQYDFNSIFEYIFNESDGNKFRGKDPYKDYLLGSISNHARLNSYYINNSDCNKINFFVTKFDESKIDILQNEYHYILEQAISSKNECSDIFNLFISEFPEKKIDHVAIINSYFKGKTDKNSNNLINYLNTFNIHQDSINMDDFRFIISSIFKSKKMELFNDYINSSLFKVEHLDIILSELGNSLSRKRTNSDVYYKESSFYTNIIELLNGHNIKTGDSLLRYLNKNNTPSTFSSLLEKKLLTENFDGTVPLKNTQKKRL